MGINKCVYVFISFSFLTVLTLNTFGRCYYLSERGNDHNTGTSLVSPWRTLQRLQKQMSFIQPGDSILLERGDTFIGTLYFQQSGVPESTIYLGAYGMGAFPVIKGSVRIDQWKRIKENIWSAVCKSCHRQPGDLFMNGKRQKLARYPDSGFIQAQPLLSSDRQFHDPSLGFKDDQWNGAEVVVKSSRWTLDVLRVKMLKGNTFYFETPSSYPLKENFSYFIQNHISALDSNGEWYYDKERKEVFLYYENLDPNSTITEASIYDYGLMVTHVGSILIDGISFENQCLAGAKIEKSSNVIFKNNLISNSAYNGLIIASCLNIKAEYNRIMDCYNNGVLWESNNNGVFSNNALLRTGLEPGRGASGNGTYIALYITGSNNNKNTIQYNTIDSTGYTAIDFRTGNTYIANNFISNFCMTKDDGGAIYTWGNAHGNNFIESNIIIGKNNKKAENERYCNGIYIDDRSKYISITGNTVAYCDGIGLLVHNASDLLITQNKLVGNGNNFLNKEKSQLLIKRDDIVEDEFIMTNIAVKNNTFVSSHEDQYCVMLYFSNKNELSLAITFLQNTYVSGLSNIISVYLNDDVSLCDAAQEYTLRHWQQFSASDNESVLEVIPYSTYKVAKNIYPANTQLSPLEGWIVWPERTQLIIEKEANALQVQPPPGGHQQALLYHEGFALQTEKIYQLSFTVQMLQAGVIEFVPLLAQSPWTAVGEYYCFKADTVVRKIVCYFKPTITNPQVRLNFKSDQTFWIGHVVFAEVSIESDRVSPLKLFYNPEKEESAIEFEQKYFYPNGKPTEGTIVIPPYGALVLYKTID